MQRQNHNILSRLLGFIDVPKSYKLTSGYIKPNKKKRRRPKVHAQGQGKLGRRGHDGTMDGPFRSSRGA